MSSERKHELNEMFSKINSSEEFLEFMRKFRTTELLNMEYPDWVLEKYWEEIDETLFKRLGIYDYWDIRRAINIDFDDPTNVYTQIEKVRNDYEQAIIEVEELVNKLDELVRTIDRKYKAIFKILSKMDSGLKAGEVLSLMENE